ncbi:ubiquitin carboxyl-terminal hydrolase MINDY-3-like [Patiria miniata]|uniref:Ubiquitin carboxyl-terminal hydrolase MINDY n=1 Tax=Patiria miniata TaxID=46514 RepID=A0A913YYD4_PATMI|nr:ubiquitin carboxyl-terminal hydrolase MINDY-3-like [Patiria miniata]
MASTSQPDQQGSSSGSSMLEEVVRLTWGSQLKEDVFARWCPGFSFSEHEPTALIQHEGGPCAVIAPLQAFILKALLFQGEPPVEWRQLDGDQCRALLLAAMTEVLQTVSSGGGYYLVLKADKQDTILEEGAVIENVVEAAQGEGNNHQVFHAGLRLQPFDCIEEVNRGLESTHEMFLADCGLLLFLYSVLLTKGLDNIREEVEDTSEPLIDGVYGHGSQSLINLMLTGSAVSNVFDNEKEVAGLKMKGICQQTNVGFLTLLENLRYCEVGAFLKNPRKPIWVIGSETHLTVLFSQEETLVAEETEWEKARRIFSMYDTEGSGFITTIMLKEVLDALGLATMPEYVDFVKQRLDPDDFGVILLNSFISEFFPNEPDRIIPEYFTVYHYNGLKRSCPNRQLAYVEGRATIPDPSELTCLSDATPIKSCIRTKWPTFEVEWKDNANPSII